MQHYYSDDVMRFTARWGIYFAQDWRQEAPMKIHTADIGPDGSPQWHPDFMRWMTAERSNRGRAGNDEQRLRTTKVMRRLRRSSVRAYEVAFRVLVQGERLRDTTRWLNDRAMRNGVPYPPHRPEGPHYVEKDAWALLIAGVSFAQQRW